MRYHLPIFCVLIAGCGELGRPTEPGGVRCVTPAPLIGARSPVPNNYIVDLHENVSARAEATRLAAKHNFKIIHIYDHVLGGFAAQMSEVALAGVRCEPTVRSVSQDGNPPPPP